MVDLREFVFDKLSRNASDICRSDSRNKCVIYLLRCEASCFDAQVLRLLAAAGHVAARCYVYFATKVCSFPSVTLLM
jgi:hypothetical protein